LRLQAAGTEPTPREPKEITMFSKTIIAALVVASAAVALTTKVNAGPRAQTAPTSHDAYYIDRASQNHDNGGN
jgi:hypothetical protein